MASSVGVVRLFICTLLAGDRRLSRLRCGSTRMPSQGGRLPVMRSTRKLSPSESATIKTLVESSDLYAEKADRLRATWGGPRLRNALVSCCGRTEWISIVMTGIAPSEQPGSRRGLQPLLRQAGSRRRFWTRVDANSAPAPSSALFQGSSAPCTGAGGSRIPGIFGNRLLSSGSRFAGRRIALRFAAAVLGHLRVRRVDSVSTQHRSFLLASLLPAFLLVSAFAVVQAQNAGSPAARPARWSDPATWPDRRVPARRRQGHHSAGQGTSSSTSVRRRWAV